MRHDDFGDLVLSRLDMERWRVKCDIFGNLVLSRLDMGMGYVNFFQSHRHQGVREIGKAILPIAIRHEEGFYNMAMDLNDMDSAHKHLCFLTFPYSLVFDFSIEGNDPRVDRFSKILSINLA